MRSLVLVLVLFLCTAGSILPAQERGTNFTTDLGFVNAAGNTSVTSFDFAERLLIVGEGWKLQQTFAVLYGRTDGEPSAEQVRASVRGDHTLFGRLAVYGLVRWDRNRFAGLHRRLEEGIGLALRFKTPQSYEFDVELGFGATQEVNTDRVASAFQTGRAASRFRQYLSKKAYLQQTVEFIPNFETSTDFRFQSESSLVAPLTGVIALKAGYVVRFDNLPEPGFRKSDRVLTTGIQLNW
jgi:putative salt-induced outer membrane protein